MPPAVKVIASNNQPAEEGQHRTRCLDGVIPLDESDRLPPPSVAPVRPAVPYALAFGCALATSSMSQTHTRNDASATANRTVQVRRAIKGKRAST